MDGMGIRVILKMLRFEPRFRQPLLEHPAGGGLPDSLPPMEKTAVWQGVTLVAPGRVDLMVAMDIINHVS